MKETRELFTKPKKSQVQELQSNTKTKRENDNNDDHLLRKVCVRCYNMQEGEEKRRTKPVMPTTPSSGRVIHIVAEKVRAES